MLDRLKSMAVFVCVVERRSFAAASNVFGLSATMVAKHIRALEERIGAKLLNRTTRTQSLTEVGQVYYQRCKQLLFDAAAADAAVDEMKSAPRGVLKIHAPVSFGSQCLAPAAAKFLQTYPDVRVDLTLSDGPVDWVEDGYEAAIRIGSRPDSGLIARQLKPYTMWLCAAPSYLRASGTPKSARDLAEHECLGFAYWRNKNVWRLSKPGKEESVQVRGRLMVNNGQALRMAAIAGLGIIMQPEILLSSDVAGGTLVRVLSDYELPSRAMHLVYHSDRRRTPKLNRFIDFVVAAFG
jgi:DNA-binding transcriptional LysR family regulator